MSIVLYGEKYWISPYVYSCFVTLKEKGISFEVRDLSLGDRDHKKAHFAKSLTTKVPALEHDGFWLAESSAIVEYLEEAFPDTKRVLPQSLRDRARARQIMSWIRSDLMALREERPTTTIFFDKATKPLAEAGRAAADKLIAVAGQLVEHGASHVFGEWTIVDADLALMLQRLVRSGDDVPAKLRDYADAQWARPSAKWFVEHARPPFEPY